MHDSCRHRGDTAGPDSLFVPSASCSSNPLCLDRRGQLIIQTHDVGLQGISALMWDGMLL